MRSLSASESGTWSVVSCRALPARHSTARASPDVGRGQERGRRAPPSFSLKRTATAAVLPHLEPPTPRSPTPKNPALGCSSLRSAARNASVSAPSTVRRARRSCAAAAAAAARRRPAADEEGLEVLREPFGDGGAAVAVEDARVEVKGRGRGGDLCCAGVRSILFEKERKRDRGRKKGEDVR